MRTPSQSQQQASFAAKAKDLQALRDAVVEAATVSGPLWISYLFVFFYLAIAAGAVTHKDLLFENPVKLPFLGVELPLIAFFVLGPLLFLIVHAYMLLHFALLAGKIGAFHGELEAQIRHDDTRARLRRQLPSNIFVQFLAGPSDIRSGVMGFMLRAIAWISLIIGPVLLLVFFQLQFLPYHDEAASWWQRVAVFLDLVLLWLLWPSIALGASLRWREFARIKTAGLLLLSAVPALLVFTVATFPGEWLNENSPAMPLVPPEWTPHRLLVAGAVDEIAQRPRSVWSNRLIVPGIDAVDRGKYDSEAKIAAVVATVSLRGRRLEGAVLSGAKLRKADFTGAQLSQANLDRADLREANLSCGGKAGFEDRKCTDLRGASLDDTQLQGAMLDYARLQGASLNRAQLQGASLGFTELRGASLSFAELHGTFLGGARLQGAVLDNAKLQGAALDSANLQGASLDEAQLQGAFLGFAELDWAWLNDAFVWRTDVAIVFDVPLIGDQGVFWHSVGKAKSSEVGCVLYSVCDWSKQSYSELVRLLQDSVPVGGLQKAALSRIWRLDPDKQIEPRHDFWTTLEKNSPARDVYRKSLAAILQRIGCEASGGPYVVRGLYRRLKDLLEPGARELAAAFLDEANCPGAKGLPEEDKARFRTIRDGTGIRPFAPRAE